MGWLPTPQLPGIGPQREWGYVLVLAEDLPEVQPESARPGARAFSCGPSRSSQASDGTATGWASAAQALSLVPWHYACPSLPGSSFPWHRVRSWCMLKE